VKNKRKNIQREEYGKEVAVRVWEWRVCVGSTNGITFLTKFKINSLNSIFYTFIHLG
jgi:hypothetical protein